MLPRALHLHCDELIAEQGPAICASDAHSARMNRQAERCRRFAQIDRRTAQPVEDAGAARAGKRREQRLARPTAVQVGQSA